MEHNFYRYLLKSETCQLEGAYEKKKRKYTFEKTTGLVWQGLSLQCFIQRCTAPGGSIKICSPNLTAKFEHRELKNMRGWTTSDVKKIENLMRTFRSETSSSY